MMKEDGHVESLKANAMAQNLLLERDGDVFLLIFFL